MIQENELPSYKEWPEVLVIPGAKVIKLFPSS